MSVVQSIEDKGPWTKELQIVVPAEDVSAEVQRIVKELSGQVRMPGFRQGKVPASLVKSRFKSEIQKEIVERLVPQYWLKAQEEKELDALIAPRVEDVEINDSEPMTFKAVVEVRPEIDLDGNREFDLPSAEVLVGEAEVEEVVERLQNDLASFDPVERAAARGDRVKLEIKEVLDESEEEPDASGAEGTDDAEDSADEGASGDGWQEIAIEVGDERVWEELSLAVTGLEAGGKGDFTHQDPPPPVAEGEEPQAAPPPRHFQIQVTEVAEKQLAEADDELAQSVSAFETFAELREDIEKRIFEDKKQKVRQERESKLLQQLTDRNPLELPEGVVAEEIQSMMRNYAERLAHSSMDIEKAGLDWNRLSEEMAPQAKQRVHAQLVLDAVASEDGLELPEDEINRALVQIAQARGESLGETQDQLQRSGGIVRLREQLLRERAVRHLLGEPLDVSPEEDVQGPGSDHDHEHSSGDDDQSSEEE